MLNTYATLVSLVAFAQDRLKKDEKGATAVEYGLMVGLIAVVIIAAVTAARRPAATRCSTSIADELPDRPRPVIADSEPQHRSPGAAAPARGPPRRCT